MRLYVIILLLVSIGCIHTSDHHTPILNEDVVNAYIEKQANAYHLTGTDINRLSHTIRESIIKGGSRYYDIIHGDRPIYSPYPFNHDHFRDIKHILMFIYASSIAKTQTQDGADEVGFVIHDPYQRLCNFFTIYATESDMHGTYYSIGKRWVAAHSGKGPLDTYGYAIVPLNALTDTEPSFPAGHRTLFVQYDTENKATYIRPESTNRRLHGPTETVSGHVQERIYGRYSRISGVLSSCRTLLWNAHNDDPAYHKPHVPRDIYNMYANIMKHNQQYTHYHTLGYDSTLRMSAIYKNLSKLLSVTPKEYPEANQIRSALRTIEQRYDHIGMRYGNEIIYDKELLPYAYWYTRYHQCSNQERDAITAYAACNHDMYRLRNPYADTCYKQIQQRRGKQPYQVSPDNVCQYLNTIATRTADAQYNLFQSETLNSYMADIVLNNIDLTDRSHLLARKPLEANPHDGM